MTSRATLTTIRRALPFICAISLTGMLHAQAVAESSSEANAACVANDAACVTREPIAKDVKALSESTPPSAQSIVNPILFVTQIPTPGGDIFASISSTFGNHIPLVNRVVRGGDLMIRYPDGSLRNLTREAGYGEAAELQTARAIAVRDPSVHWSGTKALFSMLVGAAPRQHQEPNATWQLYEVSGIGQGQTATITKVQGQSSYNNIAPFWDTNDNVLFISDAPRDGAAHLYPQLDEYESTPTPSGLWRLDAATRAVTILNHAPSGLFSPSLDSFGRVIFTRWDHLNGDARADGATEDGYNALTHASELAGAPIIANSEVKFPEPRAPSVSPAYGPVNGFRFNFFTPWEMNQDGTAELTLNHIGRQELSFGFLTRSFNTDPDLKDDSDPAIIANRRRIQMSSGLFQIKEDPAIRGSYIAVHAREFLSMASGPIVRFNGSPGLNAEQMAISDVTPAEPQQGSMPGGRFRDPLPLSNGELIASHTDSASVNPNIQFRLKTVVPDTNGLKKAGIALTPGIQRTVSWWSTANLTSYTGVLWEFQPVEVVARTRPQPRMASTETIEQQVIAEEAVEEAQLRAWLATNDLALIVTRDQTSRDRGDKQQPYNLQVKNGVKTVGNAGKVYDIAHYQILQGDSVRSYTYGRGRAPTPGRRIMPRPSSNDKNPANGSGPVRSVKIAPDGSTAAFVPARRSLTWQTTDEAGEPVVRERLWVTMQPGEIRTCAGCHGENSSNQAGAPSPTNKPQALRALLGYWKRITGRAPALRFDIDGNGSCNSETDSLILLRYLVGTRGDSLISGVAFDSVATRRTVAALQSYLSSLGGELDIDGDGQALALTDGLLFQRYTMDRVGISLTGAARSGNSRNDSAIKAYLDGNCGASSP
jgi:Hydrazine synthase alpha subunit middle domain